MSAGRLTQVTPVQQVLNNCRRQIRRHTLLVGCSSLAIVVATYILAAGLLDYLVGLPSSVRATVLLTFVTVVAVVAWKSLLRPLLTAVPAEQLGAAVDLSSPDLQESLATLISVEREGVSASEAGSAVMRDHLNRQVTDRLSSIRVADVIDHHKTRRRCGLAGVLIVAILLPLLVWPSLAKLLMQRMVSPFENLATASNLYFDVPDGNRTVARDSTVQIAATPRWRSKKTGMRPEDVSLTLIATNGDTDTRPMLFDEVAGQYIVDLTRIADSMKYRVAGGGATSQIYAITVVDAPEIRTAVMTSTPPAYSGRAIQRFDGMIGQLDVFERSQLDVLLEFNKPVRSAALVWADRDARPVTESEMLEIEFDDLSGEEVFDLDLDPDAPLVPKSEPLVTQINAVLTADRMAATFSFPADVGGDFVFEVRDEHDLTNALEPDRHLTVIYDLPPELMVRGIHDSDRFRPDDVLPVNCLAVDDIGVGELELHYQVNDGDEKVLVAADFDPGSLEVQHAFRLPLQDMSLTTGDRLTVRVRAADQRPEPGPQETWWKPFTIHIDTDAEAAGQKSLNEETQQMVDALKKLEELLQQDAKKTEDLADRASTQWDDPAREETQRLSEKEQQQGHILENLATDVATHPLMQKSAEQLRQLSEALRQDIPEALQEVVDQNRQQATEQLQETKVALEEAAKTLREEITTIEEMAKLEQDLAELNRLALNAEQLAKDARQLEADRKDPGNKPEEFSDAEWQQQLDDTQQDLMLEEQDLSRQLADLLQEKQELLQAAQDAQRKQLKSLSDVARQLAKQQTAVAMGVQQEARQAAQDARDVAKQLQQAKRTAEQLNKKLTDTKDTVPADVDKLDAAIKELQQGNLAKPKAQVDDVAKAVQETQQQLNASVDAQQPDSEQPDTQAAATQAEQLSKQLQDVGNQIARLQQDRQSQQPPDAGNTQPSDAVDEMLQRMDQLAQAAQQVAEGLQSDAAADPNSQQAAGQAAQKAQQATQDAQAGQFAEAARQLRQAAGSAQQSGQQMNAPEQQDRRQQTARLQNDLQRMAESLQNLQQDNASQLAAQQRSQQRIAEQAAELPGQLQELAERLNMDALQMAPQAQQSQLARQAAQDAEQTSQQAATELQQQDLNQAGTDGQATAEQLNRLAELAQQAGQSPSEEASPVPTEVGESVADALQDLAQAAQAMQQSQQAAQSERAPSESGQSAEQSGQGEPAPGQPGAGEQVAAADPGESGEGQPGEGQPGGEGQSSEGEGQPSGQPGKPGDGQGSSGENAGSQQLSAAAQALAQAAKQALPGQFNPGEMSDAGDSSGNGRDAMGNAALWNGLLPNAANGPAGSRDWGQASDELETETSDSAGVSRDSEYEALIRMYFREVAKASSRQ